MNGDGFFFTHHTSIRLPMKPFLKKKLKGVSLPYFMVIWKKKLNFFFSLEVMSITSARVRLSNISILTISKGRKLSCKSHKIFMFFLIFKLILCSQKCDSLKIIVIYWAKYFSSWHWPNFFENVVANGRYGGFPEGLFYVLVLLRVVNTIRPTA